MLSLGQNLAQDGIYLSLQVWLSKENQVLKLLAGALWALHSNDWFKRFKLTIPNTKT
jgi:hypothetical protein